MLTADLIRIWKRGPYIGPKCIKTNDDTYLTLAQHLLDLFVKHKGFTRGELQQALQNHLADSPDYLIHRGLSKLLMDRAEFTISHKSGIPPQILREKIFSRAVENAPIILHP